jgi:hypothetical protein
MGKVLKVLTAFDGFPMITVRGAHSIGVSAPI